MKKAKSKPVPSAARQRLADLIAARDAIVPNLRKLEAQRDRLSALEKPDSTAADELARLTVKETAALAAWSVSGEGPMPVSNAAKRQTLEKKVAALKATADSAKLASAGVLAAIQDGSRSYACMAGPVQIAAVEVLIEECEPEIEAFEKINLEASTRVTRIQQLGAMITNAAHTATDDETRTQLFSLNTRFYERINNVDARRFPSKDAAEAAADEQFSQWSSLCSALNMNAYAQLSVKPLDNPTAHKVDIAAVAAKRLAALAAKGL
jgi:hypothetical protein